MCCIPREHVSSRTVIVHAPVDWFPLFVPNRSLVLLIDRDPTCSIGYDSFCVALKLTDLCNRL